MIDLEEREEIVRSRLVLLEQNSHSCPTIAIIKMMILMILIIILMIVIMILMIVIMILMIVIMILMIMIMILMIVIMILMTCIHVWHREIHRSLSGCFEKIRILSICLGH